MRRGGRGVLAGLAVLAATAACTPDDRRSETPTRTPTPRPTATTSPPQPGPTPAPPRPRAVTIAVAGDVHFEGVLRARLDDPATALAPVTRALAAADLAIVNLETAIGTGGAPDPGKRFTFQAPPTAFDALAAAGIDVVTMANNHALDFGREPLPALFRAIRSAPVTVVGIGRDVDAAFAPAITDLDGTVVATIGASLADQDPSADPTGDGAATADAPGTADAIDPTRLLAAIRRSARSADVVVVYPHWGVQGERCPSEDQRSLARRLVDAGADVVAGSHAHRLQGDGRLGAGYVAYGLGNYAWYTAGSEASSTTGVLTLTVRTAATPSGRARVTRADWSPARIGADGLPAPTDAGARADFEVDRGALRDCAGLGD